MAQAHYVATAKESLVLELPQEAQALGIKPGTRVNITVETDLMEALENQTPPEETKVKNRKRPSVLGKYAFVAGGSEEFAAEKQVEIKREDRPRS